MHLCDYNVYVIIIMMFQNLFVAGHRIAVAHYRKVVMEDENSDVEEVAFTDSSRSPTPPKTLTTPDSTHPSFHMNIAYYMYILQAFTITGLFNAFLLYEIP